MFDFIFSGSIALIQMTSRLILAVAAWTPHRPCHQTLPHMQIAPLRARRTASASSKTPPVVDPRLTISGPTAHWSFSLSTTELTAAKMESFWTLFGASTLPSAVKWCNKVTWLELQTPPITNVVVLLSVTRVLAASPSFGTITSARTSTATLKSLRIINNVFSIFNFLNKFKSSWRVIC